MVTRQIDIGFDRYRANPRASKRRKTGHLPDLGIRGVTHGFAYATGRHRKVRDTGGRQPEAGNPSSKPPQVSYGAW